MCTSSTATARPRARGVKPSPNRLASATHSGRRCLPREIEQVVRGRVDDARAARHRRELGLEVAQVGADPALEVGEPLAEARGAAGGADIGEAIEDRTRQRD